MSLEDRIVQLEQTVDALKKQLWAVSAIAAACATYLGLQ